MQLGDVYLEWLAIEFMNHLEDTELWDAINSQVEGPLTLQDVLKFYAQTLVHKVRNEQVGLKETIRRNKRIDFSTHHFVSIMRCKQHQMTMAEILAEVVQQIEEDVAMEEWVVAIGPEEQTKSEGVTIVNPVEVGSGLIAIQGVIPDISE